MKQDVNLSEIDELLREWGYFFRDRRRLERCRSMEHKFRPHSEDFAKEGWGDMEASNDRRPAYLLSRALKTHEALMKLPKIQKWAITYYYCYPGLPKGMVLRVLRKWVGRPVTWKLYVENVDIGRFKVYAWMKGS